MDHNLYTPLHVASEAGHTAIIVALLEEGGADINMKGGERGDTALMLSVRHHDYHGNDRNLSLIYQASLFYNTCSITILAMVMVCYN